MKNTFLFLISPLALFISILFSRISGNDKAPFFILLTLAIIVGIFIIIGVITLLKREFSFKFRFLFLGASLTLLYVIISIFLSRAGLVDSNILLGFR